jgi:hypothetical protein
MHDMHFYPYEAKQPNLNLKTRSKQLLGYLPFDVGAPLSNPLMDDGRNPYLKERLSTMNLLVLTSLDSLLLLLQTLFTFSLNKLFEQGGQL